MQHNAKHNLLLIERVILLKSLSIFKETPETILAEIAHLMHEQDFPKGTVIVKEGDPGNCMYVILEGTVEVFKEKHLLATFRENDFFGELALLDTETRSATVIVKSDCRLFRIDQEPFYDLMELRPEVSKGIIKILCKRIREGNKALYEMQKSNAS